MSVVRGCASTDGFDLNGFKAINAAHGHSCGDVDLKEVAQRLKAALRTSDTRARMHGDEFVVLLPEVRKRDEIGSLFVLPGVSCRQST